MKKIICMLLVALMCIGLCSCGKTEFGYSDDNIEDSNYYEYSDEEQPIETEPAEPATQSPDVDKSEITNVKMTIKDFGEVKIELYNNEAPRTVANFVKLVEEGFYDGIAFHRLTQGAFSRISVLQGGDPSGTGAGGSDETIKGEFESNDIENNISHIRGVISMARSNDPDSASSQFFICYNDDCTALDGEYAGFGMIVEGMDVIDEVVSKYASSDGNETLTAGNQPVIEKMEIIK